MDSYWKTFFAFKFCFTLALNSIFSVDIMRLVNKIRKIVLLMMVMHVKLQPKRPNTLEMRVKLVGHSKLIQLQKVLFQKVFFKIPF